MRIRALVEFDLHENIANTMVRRGRADEELEVITQEMIHAIEHENACLAQYDTCTISVLSISGKAR